MMDNNVSVPRAYFSKTAIRDYDYPVRALVREFLQNSRDAGASSLSFDFSVNEDKKIVIVVEDNGYGMDRDTITGKLMALGETSKGNEHTGGFGVAKILLFFAHDKYQIETRNLIVRGEGGVYGISDTSDYRQGVKAIVTLADDVLEREASVKYYEANDRSERLARIARDEIAKSYLPKITITVQGEVTGADLKQGRVVEEIATGMILHKRNLDHEVEYISVRVRGLHMFDIWCGNVKFKLIAELDGYSTEYLTTNRDALRGDYKDKISKVAKSFVLNSIKGSKSTVRVFQGKSSRYSERHEELLENLNAQILEIVSAFPTGLCEAVSAGALQKLFAKAKENSPELSEDIAKLEAVATQRTVTNTTWIPLTLVDFELDHHYFVEIRGNMRKVPQKWEPQNFRSSQKMVLELWSKILSMVLADAEFSGKKFNVGYILDDGTEGGEVLANYRERTDNGFLFLLNPRNYGDEKRLPIKRSRRIELIMWLLALATHEVTHSLGYSYHDEKFCSVEKELSRKCYGRIKEFLKL